MAHFAQWDENHKGLQVLGVDNAHEDRGAEFLAVDCGLGGRWIQTSYNANIRGKFAGIGDTYDEVNDVFVSPEPVLDNVIDGEVVNETPALEG